MRPSGGSNGDFTGPAFVYRNAYGTNGPYAGEPPESGARYQTHPSWSSSIISLIAPASASTSIA